MLHKYTWRKGSAAPPAIFGNSSLWYFSNFDLSALFPWKYLLLQPFGCFSKRSAVDLPWTRFNVSRRLWSMWIWTCYFKGHHLLMLYKLETAGGALVRIPAYLRCMKAALVLGGTKFCRQVSTKLVQPFTFTWLGKKRKEKQIVLSRT